MFLIIFYKVFANEKLNVNEFSIKVKISLFQKESAFSCDFYVKYIYEEFYRECCFSDILIHERNNWVLT